MAIKLPKEFVDDFLLWAKWLKEDGDTDSDIEEIKAQIRSDWDDTEKREFWMRFVKEKADLERELIAMGNRSTEKVREMVKMKGAA